MLAACDTDNTPIISDDGDALGYSGSSGLPGANPGGGGADPGSYRSYAVWVVAGAIVVLAVIFFWPSASKTALGLVH